MSDILPNLLDVVVALKSGLTARATGKGWDDAEYHRLRKIVLSASPLAPVAPEFLRRCHTLDDFWEYIQPKFAHYAERRAYLEEQFKPLFDRTDVPIQDSGLALEVGELIGRGGFGEVYRVRHRLLDIDFAVKLFAPVYGDINDGHMERFFREARILFSLNHPNIIRVHDVGVYNHRPYIQMDLFDGSNLNQVLSKSGRIAPLRALKIVTAVAEGLRHAHEDVHVIHRDLKPSNVMIAKPGRVRILDFGLGVFVEDDIVSRVTKTGESVPSRRSLEMMSPWSVTFAFIVSSIASIRHPPRPTYQRRSRAAPGLRDVDLQLHRAEQRLQLLDPFSVDQLLKGSHDRVCLGCRAEDMPRFFEQILRYIQYGSHTRSQKFRKIDPAHPGLTKRSTSYPRRLSSMAA